MPGKIPNTIEEDRELWDTLLRARSRKPVTQLGTWGDSGEWMAQNADRLESILKLTKFPFSHILSTGRPPDPVAVRVSQTCPISPG